MRELTIRIRFHAPSLGNRLIADPASPMHRRFLMLRSQGSGCVLFMASWHRANMRAASQMLGRRQDQVDKIYWSPEIDGKPGGWEHRAAYTSKTANKAGTRERHVMHEAFMPGQVIGINCMVPDGITDDDLVSLMSMAGRYRGLSPWKPGDYGHFEVVDVRPRRRNAASDDTSTETVVERRGN